MIEFRDTFDVTLVDHMGSDERICQAARVSTLGVESLQSKEARGLINFLMKNRHGSPFEHGSMTFLIDAPIFVWREFMRHRVGFSYNETSGRYKELAPVFYKPAWERPLTQVGKAGEYRYEAGDEDQDALVQDVIQYSCRVAWESYQLQISQGIAKEVARMVLPVNIYSAAYVTCNPRSLMHFLSLRTEDMGNNLFPSFPMWEIARVADKMEGLFADLFPLTHRAWQVNKKVAP